MAVQAIPVPAPVSKGHRKFWAIVIGTPIGLAVAFAAIGGSGGSTTQPPAPKAPVAAASPSAKPAATPTATPTAEPTAVPTVVPTAVPTAAPVIAPPAPSQASLAMDWVTAITPALTAFAADSVAAGQSDGTIPDMQARMTTALASGRALQAALRTHQAPAGMSVGVGDLTKATDMSISGMNLVMRGINTNDATLITQGADLIGSAATLMTQASNELPAEMAAL